MVAHILDGKILAAQIRQTIAEQIKKRHTQGLRSPSLAVVLVGKDPASELYVRHKRKDCQDVGITSLAYDLPEETTEVELLNLIHRLNSDTAVDGILVQLPLPQHIRTET